MPVWAVTMVADEVDVVGDCIRHVLSEGLDGLIVADNLSTDGTRDVLEDLRSKAKIPFIIVDDPVVGYYQGPKMTKLAAMAAEKGAKWIVPFDIDELWCGLNLSLGDTIRKFGAPQTPVIGVPSYTYMETGWDPEEANLFKKMSYRFDYPLKYPKVLYRYDAKWDIGYGNDAIYEKGRELPVVRWDTDLALCHFPIRSPKQFINKMRRGAAAYKATTEGVPETAGIHWRGYGRVLENPNYGEPAMRQIYFSHFFCPEPFRLGLVKKPAPWCRWENA